MRKIIFILFILSLNLYATEHTIQKEKLIKSRKSDNQGTSIGNKSIISEKHHNDSFKQKTIATCNYRTDVTIDVQVDYWYDEASWNIWIGGQGYYYASNQTFSYAYESQSRTLDLPEGDHSVDCWDTEEDGGISGNTTGATTNVSWNANDYTDFGEFWFYVGSTGDPDLVVNRAMNRKVMNMKEWEKFLEKFLELSDSPILNDLGKISMLEAKLKAEGEFEKYRVEQDKNYISDFDKAIKQLKINSESVTEYSSNTDDNEKE